MGDSDNEHKQRALARVGSVLREKWRLDALLGLGGMAAVYSATHRNGKLAAVKVLHPEAALVPDVKARFLREGYLANKVGHPGAVSILDDDVDDDGTVFLVMELLEGETLDSRWNREKTLPWQQAFVIADKVLDVLNAAHKKDVVHRDLKPGNVFVCADGSIKVLDFGIARLQGLAKSIRDTGGHISLGTPGFMPHEQARGQWARVDAQSDLWAVAATLFAVITGRYVHEADTVNEQLLAAMTEPAPPIKQVLADLPDEVADVIDRSLSFDKEKRWADGPAMQRALRDVYQALVGASITAAAPLVVPGVARHRSVLPDAPTVAASDVDSLRFSSARSLSSRRESGAVKPAETPNRRRWLILIASAAAMLSVATWLATRPPPVDRSATPGLPAPVEPAAPRLDPGTVPAAPEPIATASASVSVTPALEAAAAPSAKPEPAQRASQQNQRTASAARKSAKTGTPPASAAATPAAEPATPPASAPAPVDIFTRRK